jgi:hypothetical protein
MAVANFVGKDRHVKDVKDAGPGLFGDDSVAPGRAVHSQPGPRREPKLAYILRQHPSGNPEASPRFQLAPI